MAKRYCGRWVIDVEFEDKYAEYKCIIYHDTQKMKDGHQINVLPPAHLSIAVDSPKAYDDTAHAALSFATADDLLSESELDFTDSGFRIRRKK